MILKISMGSEVVCPSQFKVYTNCFTLSALPKTSYDEKPPRFTHMHTIQRQLQIHLQEYLKTRFSLKNLQVFRM
ncbi:MAG: hypothetical protein ACP5L3_07540 [Caldisericum sp.]|uniref:hypothetical protein n=1 Tax=Caldisericum sp. TaxID=2499687 RepID=UPI003D095F06